MVVKGDKKKRESSKPKSKSEKKKAKSKPGKSVEASEFKNKSGKSGKSVEASEFKSKPAKKPKRSKSMDAVDESEIVKPKQTKSKRNERSKSTVSVSLTGSVAGKLKDTKSKSKTAIHKTSKLDSESMATIDHIIHVSITRINHYFQLPPQFPPQKTDGPVKNDTTTGSLIKQISPQFEKPTPDSGKPLLISC